VGELKIRSEQARGTTLHARASEAPTSCADDNGIVTLGIRRALALPEGNCVVDEAEGRHPGVLDLAQSQAARTWTILDVSMKRLNGLPGRSRDKLRTAGPIGVAALDARRTSVNSSTR